jgi:UDP-GlcNAc:undecaprenyl-phosphate GlcNAc-1-phosphate transferase
VIIVYKILLTSILNLIIFLNLKNLSSLINLYDIPDKKRKIHTLATPPIGGIVLFANLFLILLLDFFLKILDYNFLILFLTSAIIFIISFIDDKFILSPNKKFFFIGLTVFLFIFFNNDKLISKIFFSFYDLSIENIFLRFFITWLCIMLFLNAINLYDGINGQLALYAISIFIFFIYNNIFLNLSLIILIFLFFFLYFNLKAKIFLGDNGSFLLGFIMAFIIISNNTDINYLAAEKIFLLMFLPGVDMFRLFIERLVKSKNPFIADKNHIHHLMIKKFSLRKIFLFNTLIYSCTIILSYKINNLLLIILLLVFYLLFIYKFLGHKLKK